MISLVAGIIAEHNAFNKMCNSLPKEQGDKFRAARNAKHKEDIAHAKALEIANASRARNFWGN